MACVNASGNVSAEQKKTVYENPVVSGNLGKTDKSIQSEKISIFTGNSVYSLEKFSIFTDSLLR